jgi:hypothetical protein
MCSFVAQQPPNSHKLLITQLTFICYFTNANGTTSPFANYISPSTALFSTDVTKCEILWAVNCLKQTLDDMSTAFHCGEKEI